MDGRIIHLPFETSSILEKLLLLTKIINFRTYVNKSSLTFLVLRTTCGLFPSLQLLSGKFGIFIKQFNKRCLYAIFLYKDLEIFDFR